MEFRAVPTTRGFPLAAQPSRESDRQSEDTLLACRDVESARVNIDLCGGVIAAKLASETEISAD